MASLFVRPGAFLCRSIIFSVVIASMAGCGLTASQRSAIGTFSKSSTVMADLAAREIAETRADVVDLRQRMLQLGSKKVDLADSATDLDAAMDESEATRRIAACAAIKSYGSLLDTMATSNRTEELAAVSNTFLTNLKKVKGVSISDEKAGAIGTLVVSIGSQIIEARRKAIIVQVVQETQDPIQEVAKLLVRDFDFNEQGWMGTLRATDQEIFSATSHGHLGDVIDARKVGDSYDGRKLTEADIAGMHSAYASLKADSAKAVSDYVKLQPEILKAITDMAKAQDALFYVVQHDEVMTRGEIDAYLSQVSKLLDAVNVIRAKKHK